jgi:hypothetical protein
MLFNPNCVRLLDSTAAVQQNTPKERKKRNA